MDVLLPRETVSDDECRLVAIHLENGQAAKIGDLLFEFESSKSVFNVCAEVAGRLEWDSLEIGEFYPVGSVVARVVESVETVPAKSKPSPAKTATLDNRVVSEGASSLLQDGLPTISSERRFVRSIDVQSAKEPPPVAPISGSTPVDQEFQRALDAELARRRLVLRKSFDRHVPTGTVLNDRWELAQSLGFGTGTSIYDEALVVGDVRIGRDSWVGPFTVLDGAHAPLVIGDSTSIAAGVQVYTHDAIARFLTGNPRLRNVGRVQIGSCCFIGPGVVVGPNSTLGDHCFVAAGAYVQGAFPAYSFLSGNPACRVGTVVIQEERVIFKRDELRK